MTVVYRLVLRRFTLLGAEGAELRPLLQLAVTTLGLFAILLVAQLFYLFDVR